MSEGHIDRRRVLTFGAVTALGAWSGFGGVARTLTAGQKDQAGDPDVVPFAVTIPGCPDASKNIREIAIDELNIDAPRTRGRDQEIWHVRPGDVHTGSAKFTSACTLGGSKELQKWFQEAAKGKGIRKNITVTLFKSDKSAGRSYTLFDCFPTQWSTVNFDTSSTVQTETLTVKIGRIEFKT